MIDIFTPDVLHDLVSVDFPWHSTPPKAGVEQARALMAMPTLQEELMLQFDHSPHIAHVPSTAEIMI